MRRSSFNTSASSGVSASGIFRATVVSVGDDDLLRVKIPKLGLNNVYEGVSYAGPTPAAGDLVFVGFLEGKSGSFVAFTGVADSGNTGDPAGDITSVVAGTNLNGGGSSGTVTVNLDSDITLTSVTADAFYGDLHGAIHLQVKNVDSVALSQGDPVYATGAVGASGAIQVQGSSAGSAGTMPAMGLLDQDLAVNGEGHVVVSGVLQNFDTDTPGYSVGDELYVAVSGGLTTTRPSGASELVQRIGKVIRVQQQTGEILIQGAGRTNDVPNNIVAGGLAIDTDTLYVDATNDRVGIGTTSPTHTLTVDGNTMITANQSYYINSDTSGVGRLRLHWASSTGHAYVDYKDDLNFRANGTGGAVTFKADGKVGIGTTSVTTGHILETRGAVLISSTTGVGNTHFPYTDGRFYYTADPETGGTGDHVFRHYSGGSYVEQMRILENGNVGIGDSTPSYKLDVNGTARFTDQVYVQSILNVTNDLKVDTDTLFVDVSTDRVGINDSTPSYSLDVNGAIRATSDIRGGTFLMGSSDDGIGAVTGQYGSVQTRGTGAGNWEGYSINGQQVFMGNGTETCGIYNDVDNQWLLYFDADTYTRLYDSDGIVAFGANNATTTGGGSGGNGLVGVSNECGGFSGTTAVMSTSTVAGVTMKRLGFSSSSYEFKSNIEDLTFSDEAFMSLRPITFHPNGQYVDTTGDVTEMAGGHVIVPDDEEAGSTAGLMPLKRAGFGLEDLWESDDLQLLATEYAPDLAALCSVLVLKLQQALTRIEALEAQ